MRSEDKELSNLLNELNKYINNRLITERDSVPVKLRLKSHKPERNSSAIPIFPPVVSHDNASSELEALRRDVLKCNLCELCKTKKNYVFGEGDHSAGLMFIGEAPGYSEDIQGRPFVGRAGQLLDKILKAMGLNRETVYIANILKCRPPNNRNPLPAEIESCKYYLTKQVELIKPSVICALGLFAGQFLLDNPTLRIGEIRGKQYDYQGIPVIPTYHPAYLLRSPGQKKVVWEDMIKIMQLLGLKNKYTKPFQNEDRDK